MPSVRRVNWAKFRVAAVFLVAVAILSTLVYLLTGGTLLQQKAVLYLYVPDATGVSADAPVRVDGIGVGKVSLVSLSGSGQPSRVVRVTLSVERDRLASIPVDSYAQLSTDTLIGDKFVDITSGKELNHIAPNSEITFKDQPELMKSLDLTQFQQQLRVADATLTDIEQGKSRVGQFIVGEAMYDDLLKDFADLQRTILSVASEKSTLGQALYSDEMYRQIGEPVAALDRSLALIQSGEGAGGQLFRDSAQYEQLRASAHDLQNSIAVLRSKDFMQSDRAYGEWTRYVTSLIRSVDEMAAGPQFNSSQVYENLNGLARETRATVRQFREDPRKFLRLKLF